MVYSTKFMQYLLYTRNHRYLAQICEWIFMGYHQLKHMTSYVMIQLSCRIRTCFYKIKKKGMAHTNVDQSKNAKTSA